MKKYIIGGIVGFVLFPISLVMILTAAYGSGPIEFLAFMLMAEREEHSEFKPERLTSLDDIPFFAKSVFIESPGASVTLASTTLYRYEPVIDLHDGPDFETCFTVTDTHSSLFKEDLGLKIFLADPEKAALKEALIKGKDTFFTLENGDLLTRFYLDGNYEPAEKYEQKLTQRPDEADLTLLTNNRETLRLVEFAASLTPDRKPPACTGEDDLHTIDNWDAIMNHYFPEQ